KMTAPLIAWEREQAEAMKVEIARAYSDRQTQLAQLQRMRVQAARHPPSSPQSAHARKAISDFELQIPEVPLAPRLWTQDVTPEKLGMLMADHGERIAIISDEGGIFDILAGRYSRGVPNLDLFLQSHAGAPYRVDRANRPSVVMQRPALTMVLCP